MAIHCPQCRHSMTVKDPKPGRYKPTCSKCGRKFSLTIFPEAGKPPLVEALPEASGGDPQATVAPPAAAAGPSAAQTVPPAAADATAMFAPGQPAPGQPGHKPAPPAQAPREAIPPREAEATAPPPGRASLNQPTLAAPAEATAMFAPTAAGQQPGNAQPDQRQYSGQQPGGQQPGGAGDPQATGDWTGAATRLDQTAAVPASAQRSAEARHAAVAPAGTMPETIDGYRLVKELGRGAMGAVYLAKQVSLDRDVALKVIQAQWASDPAFIARFVREAYAAAQLTHHNVVQIYDLGADKQTHFFSMEYVRGTSLDRVVAGAGKLEPKLAASYTLQAARGLDFAHARGMVHRDVKPANLLLNEDGVVKVADLGLVKTPALAEAEEGDPAAVAPGATASKTLAAATAEVTLAGVAMGTPAYMAPEQAENAAGVDHRADIYSLGCTMYVMLTGRPPFEGGSALEVMSKHKTAPIVPPDAVVKSVPKELADITLKMVAKKPEQRYGSLKECIGDLERYIAGGAERKAKPGPDEARALDEHFTAFNKASLTTLRGLAPWVFLAGCAVLGLAALALGFWGFASGVAGLAVMTFAAHFALHGALERTHLFAKFREFLWASRLVDWLTWIVGGLLFVAVLFLVGWLWWWLAFAALAAGLAAGFYFGVEKPLAAQRAAPLRLLQLLVKDLRLAGVAEDAIRKFVARHSGDVWEEAYEQLFGYPAKLAARAMVAELDEGRRRSTFRSWRDGLIRRFEAKARAARETKDRKLLRNVEEQGLAARGVDPKQAKLQAAALADAVLDDAAQARQAQARHAQARATEGSAADAGPVDPNVARAQKRARIKAMLAEARQGKTKPAASPLAPVLAFFGLVFGGKPRLLAGLALLVGFALWANQNGVFSGVAKTKPPSSLTVEGVTDAAGDMGRAAASKATRPLSVPVVGRFFDGFAPGAAGLTLLLLGMFRGWKMSLFAWPAAAIMLFGASWGLPGWAFLGGPPTTAIAAGAPLALLGLLLGRTADE